jgi:hypothetical protein
LFMLPGSLHTLTHVASKCFQLEITICLRTRFAVLFPCVPGVALVKPRLN